MIIILLLFYVKCGHIHSGGLIITTPLATKATEFKFQFALDQSIDQDEYLKIQFPFSLNSDSINAKLQRFTTSSTGEFGNWNLEQLGENNNVNIEDISEIQSEGNIDNTYYLCFNQTLKSKTWYIIILYAKNLQVQTSGYKNPIRFWTVSSYHQQAIIYDENPSFAQIALQSLPQQTLKIDITYTSNKLGLNQLVTINIQPTISIGQKSFFVIEIDSNYKFIPIDETTECEISSSCSCSISLINTLNIQCSIDLVKENLFTTVTTNIQNSLILLTATQSTPISVYSIVGNTYLEYNIKKDQIKLNKLILNVNIFLLWGMNIDDQLITLYKPLVGSIGVPINSVKIQFILNSPTPQTEQLITITIGDADSILQSSISHNLGNDVKCYFQKSESLIVCKYVTQLLNDIKYYVSFKCSFTSTASTTQTNFGRVTIKSVIRNTQPYKTYILAGPSGVNIKIQDSQEYIDSSVQSITNWGYNYIAFGDQTQSFNTAFTVGNGRTVGLKIGEQRIIFYIKVLPNQMCLSTYSYCSAGQQPELFMKLLYNKNNIKQDNVILEQSNICTQCSQQIKNYTDNDQYISFKCSKNYNTCTQLFNGNKGFGFIGEILQYPSLYPNDQLLDFIVAFYQAPTGSTEQMATFVSAQYINAYVIGTDTKTLQASYINYLTSGSGINTVTGQNKGEKIPTLLRIMGTISKVGEHVGIFVDSSVETFLIDSIQLNEENDDFNTQITSKKICSINNCIWYGHRGTTYTYSDVYTHQRMVLLKDFTGSQQFDIIIGLKNYGVKPESIVVASLNSNQNGFDVVYAERIFGGAWQIPNLLGGQTYYKNFGITFPNQPWDNNNDWNSFLAAGNIIGSYKINDLTQIKPGSTIQLTITTTHTDSSNIVNQNNGNLWGAGFTMSNALNFNPTNWLGGTCIKANDILFCPFDLNTYIESNGQLIGQFIVPTTWGGGTILNQFKYGFSNSAGNMVIFKNEIQSTLSNSYINTCTITNWLPINPNTKIQEQIITFKTLLNYNLQPNQIFYIILTLSQMPNGLSIDQYCNYIDRNNYISCTIISSGSIIKFKSQIISTTQYLIQDELKIIFYLSHIGLDTDNQSFQTQFTITTDINIIEQCQIDGQLSFNDITLSKTLIINDFQLENNYQESKSSMQFKFQIDQRQNLQFHQRLQLSLGFIATSNIQLLSASNQRCLFYNEDNTLNHHWQYLYYDPSNKQLIFEQKQLYYLINQIYQIKCTNIKNPDGQNYDDIILIWAYYDSIIDTKYTILQSNTIQYQQLITQKIFNNIPKLIKILNAPGIGSFYEFQYIPSRTNMTYNDKILIEFSTGQLVIQKQLHCSLNDIEIDCKIENRRITLLPQQLFYSRLLPNKLYNISIGPIIQPKSLDGFGKIWIAAQNENQIMEQIYIVDQSIQTTLPSLLPYISVSFSQFITRINKVYLRINFTAPIRTVNFDKCLIIQLGEEFRIPQLRIKDLILECRLYRMNDITKTNYTTQCQLIKGQLIKIIMKYDPINSRQQQQYQLEIRSLITPDLVTLNNFQQYFPYEIQFYITDLDLLNVYYIAPPCIQYIQTPLLFKQQDNQLQFQWYIYNKIDNTYEKLIPIIGQTKYPTYQIYRGIIEQDIMLFLGLDTPLTQFEQQVNITIQQSLLNIFGSNEVITNIYKYNNINIEYLQLIDPNPDEDLKKQLYQIITLLTQNPTIEIGDNGYYFHIAAKTEIGSGIYYLNFDRQITNKRITKKETITIDTYSIIDSYSIIPTIAFQINTEKQCHISVSVLSNRIPIGGLSQPIILSTTCIPISELYIQVNVQDPLIKPLPIIMSIKQRQYFYQGNPKEKLSYQFQLETINTGSPGDTNVTFTLYGQVSNQYTIDDLQLTLIKNTDMETLVLNSSIDDNQTQITANCSMDGQLLWTICQNKLSSNTFLSYKRLYSELTINANLYNQRLFNYLNPLNQYLQYYQQNENNIIPSDIQSLYSRQVLYGIIGEDKLNYMTGINKLTNKIIKLNKIEQNMQIQLACLNLYGKITDIQIYDLSKSINIITRNHTLITMQFQREISINQINNLLCSIKELLKFNIHHISNIQCQICNPNLLYYNKKSWSDVLSLNETYETILNQKLIESTTNQLYYFYINNYDSDILNKFYTYINKLSNDSATLQFAKLITNTTTDPEISYLLRYLTLTNYTEDSHDSAQNQITIQANMTSNQIIINITNTQKVLVFLGIQKFTSQLDFSSPLNLRRGLTGNGIKLEQYILLQNGESSYTFNIIPYNTTSFKYFLQWSSAPLLANCLSSQFQETQLLILEYNQPIESITQILKIFIILIILQ